jgi:hypothetical protein
MVRNSVAIAAAIAAVFGAIVAVSAAAEARDQRINGFRHFEPLRPAPSTFCRVTGMDAQGVQRSTMIRVDGDRSWANVQEVALTECRAGYRLSNCAIVTCR